MQVLMSDSKETPDPGFLCFDSILNRDGRSSGTGSTPLLLYWAFMNSIDTIDTYVP